MRKDDGARYFGPFAHAGALRATLNLMRDKFGLRSCRPYQPGEYDFKHCLAPVIKKCPAPCVGKISPEDYRTRVLAACEFLEGKSRDTVAELETQMHEAAVKMNFERAAQFARHGREPQADDRADAPVHRAIRCRRASTRSATSRRWRKRSRCRICRW